jgi:hypothetical protein
MTKGLLFSLLLGFSYVSFSQKIRFTDSTNKWSIATTKKWWTEFGSDSYLGDSIINGTKYRVSSYGYVREDTGVEKVFVKNFLSKDTNEIVLYNYNLVVGDTLRYNYVNDTFAYFISKVDSILINSVIHKVWRAVLYESLHGGTLEFSIIEGIGSTGGPKFSAYPLAVESRDYLICFENNFSRPNLSTSVFADIGYNFDNDTSCTLNIQRLVIDRYACIAAPNPVNANTKLYFEAPLQSGNLCITNTMGQVVLQHSIKSEKQILIGDAIKSPGIYFYRVTDNASQKAYSGKLVFE